MKKLAIFLQINLMIFCYQIYGSSIIGEAVQYAVSDIDITNFLKTKLPFDDIQNLAGESKLRAKTIARLSVAMKSGPRRNTDGTIIFHSSGIREWFVADYIKKLHEGYKVNSLVFERTGILPEDIENCIKPLVQHNIPSRPMLRPGLPQEFAADFENYTDTFAQQWFKEHETQDQDLITQFAPIVSTILARKRGGYDFVLKGRKSSSLTRELDLLTREYIENKMIFLHSSNIDASIEKVNQNPHITHIIIPSNFKIDSSILCALNVISTQNRDLVLGSDNPYHLQRLQEESLLFFEKMAVYDRELATIQNLADVELELHPCVRIVHYFYDTPHLNIDLLQNIRSISHYFLQHSRGRKTLDLRLMKFVKKAGTNFLYDCQNLENLYLPPNLVTVGIYFLEGGINLETLMINKQLFERLGGNKYFNKQNFPKLQNISFYE